MSDETLLQKVEDAIYTCKANTVMVPIDYRGKEYRIAVLERAGGTNNMAVYVNGTKVGSFPPGDATSEYVTQAIKNMSTHGR